LRRQNSFEAAKRPLPQAFGDDPDRPATAYPPGQWREFPVERAQRSGLAAFGVAHDSGLFESPDGFDHSARFVTASTSSTTSVATGLAFNTIEGDDFKVSRPYQFWTLKSSI
jgi:hypothetical protein